MFLCASSHPGVHVAQKEEADGGEYHDDLRHPEGRVPAVLFGNRVEGEPRHKSSHCSQKDKQSNGESWRLHSGCDIQYVSYR